MPYKLHFQPKPGPSPSLDEYMARFLAAGLDRMPDHPCVTRRNFGIIVFKDDDAERGLYAYGILGLTTLGFYAEEVRPRVEEWLHVAEQTDSLIFDGEELSPLVDEASVAACVDRIVVKRRACLRVTSWKPRSDGL